MSNSAETDWEKIDQLEDEQIDTSDSPPLTAEFFSEAELVIPEPKKPITIRIDQDVLDWFKAQGKGYQTRMNAVLRLYMESQSMS